MRTRDDALKSAIDVTDHVNGKWMRQGFRFPFSNSLAFKFSEMARMKTWAILSM